ncbi:hypothetical protein J6590_055467 [Homalodisca vitripennis]|nr:hypothetical protein J6590_055467 [Homalodisca vitripennis]
MRRPHRRAVFKSGSYERGIQHFECRSVSHACGRSKKETKIPLGSLAHIKYMLLRAKVVNTGHNTSAFVYQQPTTDQRALANGNRHGRQKQDGGNKKEGGQEWAPLLLLVHAR